MSQFLNLSYWFTLNPPQVSGLMGNLVFGGFIAVLVCGIAIRLVAKHRSTDHYIRQLGFRFAQLFLTMGFIGVLLFFFSYERIAVLGARFLYPVWMLAFFLWFFFLVRYARRDIPLMRAREMERQARQAYMPGPRKKKSNR